MAGLARSRLRGARVLAAILRLDGRNVDVTDHIAEHRHVLADHHAIVVRQRERVQMPGDLRRWIAGGAALERHGRTGLHRLLDELVDELRCDLWEGESERANIEKVMGLVAQLAQRT